MNKNTFKPKVKCYGLHNLAPVSEWFRTASHTFPRHFQERKSCDDESLCFCLCLKPLKQAEYHGGRRTWNAVYECWFAGWTPALLLKKKGILGTHEENESAGSMEDFVVITQGKGHKNHSSVWVLLLSQGPNVQNWQYLFSVAYEARV